jgi:hypothetical protein
MLLSLVVRDYHPPSHVKIVFSLPPPPAPHFILPSIERLCAHGHLHTHPQLGVYHQGAIRLVKCSSNYSQNFERIDLHDPDNLRKLRASVRLGVWFHFSKFYILLMPFYCGVNTATIPLSYVCGGTSGFVLMWAVFRELLFLRSARWGSGHGDDIPRGDFASCSYHRSHSRPSARSNLLLPPPTQVVHEKYIGHRSVVSAATIFLLSILSSLIFTRGMAWIQVVWNWRLFGDEDVLLLISFFSWLAVLAAVHALFVFHTLKTEVAGGAAPAGDDERMPCVGGMDEEGANVVDANVGGGTPAKIMGSIVGRPSSRSDGADGGTMRRSASCGAMRRNSSYSSFVFDPWTRFNEKEGRCQFADHPDLDGDSSTKDSTDPTLSGPLVFCEGDLRRRPSTAPPLMTKNAVDVDQGGDFGFFIETPAVVADDGDLALDVDEDDIDNPYALSRNDAGDEGESINPATAYPVIKPDVSTSDKCLAKKTTTSEKNRRPACCRYACCDVFVWNTPEYQRSSRLWKFMCWIKIIVIAISYLICLYFTAVSIGATSQINKTRALLPSVHEALYSFMNEGPVCAFDNRGQESNITTFPDKDAAHDAGFLILHCGACGACSSWKNLIIQHSTRLTINEHASRCAKDALFGGGEDAITECLMKPEIGFGEDCAICWMEDIVCTVEKCSLIFLQSQMINNVGNFAVGPHDITSATCEEAHCEVGLFVPCVGATRRRMNIGECPYGCATFLTCLLR